MIAVRIILNFDDQVTHILTTLHGHNVKVNVTKSSIASSAKVS